MSSSDAFDLEECEGARLFAEIDIGTLAVSTEHLSANTNLTTDPEPRPIDPPSSLSWSYALSFPSWVLISSPPRRHRCPVGEKQQAAQVPDISASQCSTSGGAPRSP